jgi:hypothetical protein
VGEYCEHESGGHWLVSERFLGKIETLGADRAFQSSVLRNILWHNQLEY